MQASNRRRRHLASRKRQGILGSTTVAYTSVVSCNTPKRMGPGVPLKDNFVHQSAGVLKHKVLVECKATSYYVPSYLLLKEDLEQIVRMKYLFHKPHIIGGHDLNSGGMYEQKGGFKIA